MDQRLQGEIWETQVLLYWILGFLLLHFSATTMAHILGWICVYWGFFAMGATFKKLHDANRSL